MATLQGGIVHPPSGVTALIVAVLILVSSKSSPAQESSAAAHDHSARETSALLCAQNNFNDWVKSQGHPLPEPDVRRAKYIEISNQCRRPLGLPDIVVKVPDSPAAPNTTDINALAARGDANARIDPRITEIREAVVDLRASIADQMIDGMAAMAARQLAPGDPSWNAQNPRWPSVLQAIRVDLRADVTASMGNALASAQELWNRALSASLSEDDITQLLRFFRSDQGQRYIHFQRSLDAIASAASAEIVTNIIGGQGITAPTPQDKNDTRIELLGYSLSMQTAQRDINGTPAPGAGGMSPQAVLTSIANLAASTHRPELDALRLKYQRDLDGFGEFNKSSPLQRVLSAYQTATQQWSTDPGQRALVGAIVGSMLTRTPAWRVVYEKDNPHGAAPASSAAIKAECVALESVSSSHQPPEILGDARECVNQDKYPEAAALFALGGIDSQFDAARVSDKTAGQAGQVLIMGLFDGLPEGKRSQFETTVRNISSDQAALGSLCTRVNAIGYPTYYPAYMIQHGMGAVMAALGGKEKEPAALDPAFDAGTTWSTLQVTYLKCPAGAAAPAGVAPPSGAAAPAGAAPHM